MNAFEKGTRTKVRFNTSKGLIDTEAAWDLSLTSLDALARGVNKKLKEEAEESFIQAKPKTTSDLELQLEILKHIINVKLAEADKAKNKSEKEARLSVLREALETKKSQELFNKSPEELQQLIDEAEKM